MDWVYSKRTDLEGRTDQIRSINNKRIAIAHNVLCDISNTAVSYTSLRECRLGVSSAGFRKSRTDTCRQGHPPQGIYIESFEFVSMV